MDVAHHRDRGGDMYNVALAHEQLFGLGTDGLDDRVGQQLLFVQTFDTFVEIDAR